MKSKMNPLLVTHKWLYEAILNRRVTVFWCADPYIKCSDEDLDEFIEGHILSARPLICTKDLYPKVPVPPISEFCKWTGSQGILSTQSLILYQDDMSSLHIYRIWWQLQYHQMRNVSILAGNCNDWSAHGLPVEKGLPLKKNGFREANIRPDHYLYYSPHDLELFFTGVKSTKVYTQKPFIFAQLVYVGIRHDDVNLKKFFHHMTRRFKDQITDNKLEELKAIKHKEYIEQRKRNRLLYYSIFDTENLDPPRTLQQLQYIRSTSPPTSKVFDTIVCDGDTPATVHIIPYDNFIDHTGRPIFMPCLLSTNSSEPARYGYTPREQTIEYNNTYSNESTTHEQYENIDGYKQIQEKRETLNEIFSSNKINLNKPTLFMGDSIEQVAFIIFAAALAYGGGIFQYTATVLEDKLITNINRALDESARTKLVRDLDTYASAPSKPPPQRSRIYDQSGFRRNSKNANDQKKRIVMDKNNVDEYKFKKNTATSSALNSENFSQLATKHQIIENTTEKLFNITPNISQSHYSNNRFVKFNVYTPRYCQEDLDLIAKGLHPSGRKLSNTERFKLSLHLPITELEGRKIDYSDPSTVTMILDEHINSVPSVKSKLVCTHSRGNVISRSLSPHSLISKFFNAYERLEWRVRVQRVSECRFRWKPTTYKLDSQYPMSSALELVDIASTSTQSSYIEKNSQSSKKMRINRYHTIHPSSLIHNVLTRSTMSPSKANICYDIFEINSPRNSYVGRLTFADQEIAISQSSNRDKKGPVTGTNTRTTLHGLQKRENNTSLDEIDDYFLLLTEQRTCNINQIYETPICNSSNRSTVYCKASDGASSYSFKLRHCFSELIIIPSLILSDTESSTPPSMPTSMVQHVVNSPSIRFLIEKYGSKYFNAKASYPVLLFNEMEYTFFGFLQKIVDFFRPRFVALLESPTEWLMQSMTVRHLSQSSIYDVALSIYLTAEELGLLQASHIKDYEIGRTRYYWDILSKAYSKH